MALMMYFARVAATPDSVKRMVGMGAEVTVENGYIKAKAKRLKGARINMDVLAPSTQLPMATVHAAGVVFYANYLNFMERARTEWLARSTARHERWLRRRAKRIQVIDFFYSPMPRTTRYFLRRRCCT